MVTNSLRLEDIRWDEVKDLTRIQNENGIKHNRMGQEQTGVFQLQIRYASYLAIEWLDPMKEASSSEGAFLVSATPPSRRHRGWVLVTVVVWSSGWWQS